MFRNQLKISFRKIINDKTFSVIKILSLAISMACSILILLWVNDEISYDNFHPNSDRTYRVLEDISSHSGIETYGPICAPAGAAIKEKFPQVEYSARTFIRGNHLVKYKDKSFYEGKMIFSEPDLLKIFKIPFIKGNPVDALIRPNTMLITKGACQKYFGDEDPIGKLINVNKNDYEITGLIEDSKSNSILQYEFIASLETWKKMNEFYNWYNTMFFTYIQIKPNINIEEFKAGLDTLAFNYVGDYLREKKRSINFHIEPLTDVHLNSPVRLDENIHGHKIYVNIFQSLEYLYY